MIVWLVLAAMLTCPVLPPDWTPVRTDKSPSGAVLAEHFWLETGVPEELIGRRQIWLRDVNRQQEPRLLFEHQRIAEVLFSPDENWIAINDQPLSDLADVRLFRRIRGLDYKETGSAQPGQKCWALLDRIARRPVSGALDHAYVYALRWSPDTRALLLAATGHLANDLSVRDWLCVFDIKAFKASTDLRLMNRGAINDRRRPADR